MIVCFAYLFGFCRTASRAGVRLLSFFLAGGSFCYCSVVPCMCDFLYIAADCACMLMLRVGIFFPSAVLMITTHSYSSLYN